MVTQKWTNAKTSVLAGIEAAQAAYRDMEIHVKTTCGQSTQGSIKVWAAPALSNGEFIRLGVPAKTKEVGEHWYCSLRVAGKLVEYLERYNSAEKLLAIWAKAQEEEK
jgi:hypothetical protein